jgi:hypothetical protein
MSSKAKPEDEKFVALQQLAAEKGMKIVGSFDSTGRLKCGDCETSLPSGKWYSEDVVYYEDPMITYWSNQGSDFKTVSHSWPSGDRKHLCRKCFGERDDARVNKTASRQAALQAAASSGIKLDKNPGPYFPGRTKRQCLYCEATLSHQGWYFSSMKSKNGVAVNACYDVGQMGNLIPIAYKVKDAKEETHVCRSCYQACDGDIEL